MAINESVLAAELQGRHGVTTRERLRRLGLTDREISGLVARGRLLAKGNGVLVHPASPSTFEQLVAVACALTGGVASFPTAGVLWKFRKTPRGALIHITIEWGRRIKAPPGVVLHRTRALPRADVVRRRDGIALTSPPRTVFDAARFVSRDDLESMIEQGIHRENFTIPTLWAIARRLHAPARDGCLAFARVLACRPMWRKPVESDHEIRLERAMLDRGFPPLTRGHRLEIGPNDVIHPDLGIPEDCFFVEIDHFSWHGGRVDIAYDCRRDIKAGAVGFHIERVTDTALDDYLDETVENLWRIWQRRRGVSCTVAVHETPQ